MDRVDGLVRLYWKWNDVNASPLKGLRGSCRAPATTDSLWEPVYGQSG